jgi:probable O-glycosylation ligase (exosortase A-associated)
MAVVIGLLFLKNRRRLLGAILLAVLLIVGSAFAPESWTQRMQTITTYESDGSAMSRLHAWRLAWRLALARPLFGWGPQGMEDKTLYDVYYPDSPSRNDVHSSYFQHLAEGGFLGFGVFVGFLAWAVVRTQILSTRFRRDPTHGWIAGYADMFQISMLAFAVCATFLEKAFFDLFYTILGMTTVLNGIAQPLLGKRGPVRQPSAEPNPLLSLEAAAARGR